MTSTCILRCLGGLLGLALLPFSVPAADLAQAKDGSGVYGYKDTPVLPWCGFRVHDPDRPAPARVAPGAAPECPGAVPADAVVLFNGKDLDAWKPTAWRLTNGCVEATTGDLSSKAAFGSFQAHVEWMTPAGFEGPWYNRGNNGVLLHGLYEIQIFDSFTEKLYPDGQAASVYGQTPPRVNACRAPGQWQSFDIVFTAPEFKEGVLASPARVTLFHNGLAAHLEQQVYGETGHRIVPEYKSKAVRGPLALSGHGCPVRFRNIWVRPL